MASMEPSDREGEGARGRHGVDHWAGVIIERRFLAPYLATLTPEQWDAPTLCEGWRVRDVVAHLTYSWSNTVLGVPTWLRHRDDIDRAFALYARRRAKA